MKFAKTLQNPPLQRYPWNGRSAPTNISLSSGAPIFVPRGSQQRPWGHRTHQHTGPTAETFRAPSFPSQTTLTLPECWTLLTMPHASLRLSIPVISSLQRWQNWGPGRWSNVPKVTQLRSGVEPGLEARERSGPRLCTPSMCSIASQYNSFFR